MPSALATAGRIALDLLYPPRCALCGQGGPMLCDACLAVLPHATGARCDVCWSPRRLCDCLHIDFAFRRLRSAFRYEGEVRRLVHALKFGGQSSLAAALGAPLLATFEAHVMACDVIVPVPLTGLRHRRRGYNQAALLAKELSKATGAPAVEALSRTHSVREQARSASADERRRNVAGAFAARRPEAVQGKTVLLVDDVATTGATLNACARVLLQSGALRVEALTLARED